MESAEILQREVREPGRKKRKQSKKTARRRQGRRRRQKKNGKQTRMDGRAECLADVVQAIKNYKKAQSQYRQGNRISSWMKNMDKKKEKAADQFKNASDALESATGGGMSCNGGDPDTDAAEAQAVLKNCSTTAAMKCDSTAITGLNSSKLDSCKNATKTFVTAFDVRIIIIFLT